MPDNNFKKTDTHKYRTYKKHNADAGECILSNAAAHWVESRKIYWKPGTYTVYMQRLTKYILPFFGKIKVTEITEETMEQFASYLIGQSKDSPLSENYISQICGTVRRILFYAEKKYHCCIAIPCSPVSKGHSHKIMLPSPDSLRILEQYLMIHCKEDTCLGILIAFHTGIRIGELSALTWHDIDLQEGLIVIRQNILRVKDKNAYRAPDCKMTQIVKQAPKTFDSCRTVPIPEKLLPLLRMYRKESAAYIISGVKKPWAEPRTIQYRFKNILEKCCIEYFNFHMLRHAFATRCVSMGLDVKSLSEILGHSSVQITLNLYVHTTIQQKKIFMQQYNSFFNAHPESCNLS